MVAVNACHTVWMGLSLHTTIELRERGILAADLLTTWDTIAYYKWKQIEPATLVLQGKFIRTEYWIPAEQRSVADAVLGRFLSRGQTIAAVESATEARA